MSWHGPLSYWDVQYILARREARARRFLCWFICWGRTVSASQHGPGVRPWHRTELCGRGGLLFLVRGLLARKPLPAAPGLGEVQVSQTSTALCCTQPCPAGAELLRWFGEAGCCSLGCCMERWAQPVSSTWGQRSDVTFEREQGGRGGSTGCTAQLLLPAGRGWVPAAKQESKWKTMTYRKLREARLVSEDYWWAGYTNTGNRC